MIDWNDIKHFSKDGDAWSEDPDQYASAELIKSLDAYRDVLGFSVHPSPVEGALARFDDDEGVSPTSQHYVGGMRNRTSVTGKQSRAIDVFTTANVRTAYLAALTSRLFGGIGVYFDTRYRNRPWCMLHVDLRNVNSTVVWYRQKGEYYYPMRSYADMQRFFQLLYDAQ